MTDRDSWCFVLLTAAILCLVVFVGASRRKPWREGFSGTMIPRKSIEPVILVYEDLSLVKNAVVLATCPSSVRAIPFGTLLEADDPRTTVAVCGGVELFPEWDAQARKEILRTGSYLISHGIRRSLRALASPGRARPLPSAALGRGRAVRCPDPRLLVGSASVVSSAQIFIASQDMGELCLCSFRMARWIEETGISLECAEVEMAYLPGGGGFAEEMLSPSEKEKADALADLHVEANAAAVFSQGNIDLNGQVTVVLPSL